MWSSFFPSIGASVMGSSLTISCNSGISIFSFEDFSSLFAIIWVKLLIFSLFGSSSTIYESSSWEKKLGGGALVVLVFEIFRLLALYSIV